MNRATVTLLAVIAALLLLLLVLPPSAKQRIQDAFTSEQKLREEQAGLLYDKDEPSVSDRLRYREINRLIGTPAPRAK